MKLKLDFVSYYSDALDIDEKASTPDEMKACCPFHKEKTPSFSVNRKTGLWHCFGKCNAGGDIISFHAKKNNMQYNEAMEALRALGKIKTINPDEIAACHRALLSDKSALTFLTKQRLWSLEMIKKFEIGYSKKEKRVWFPVKTDLGYANIRKYDFSHQYDKSKKFLNVTGGEAMHFFPEVNLGLNPIFVFEGEPDCMLALSMGYNAVTVTGGAGTWPPQFMTMFKEKDIVICYDVDPEDNLTGQEGSVKIAKILSNITRTIKVIELPSNKTIKLDFTDYIKSGKTKDDFDELVRSTDYFSKGKSAIEAETNVPAKDLSLDIIAKPVYIGTRVKCNIVVNGKDLKPYSTPKDVHFTCSARRKVCGNCRMYLEGGNYEVQIAGEAKVLLSMIQCTDDQRDAALRKYCGINKCMELRTHIKSYYSLEEISVIPEMHWADHTDEQQYIARSIYTLSHNIKTNAPYSLEGIITADPRTQGTTILASKAEPTQTALDKFKVDSVMLNRLKIFQSKGEAEDEISAKLESIYADLAYNVTYIYGRNDILEGMDLVYHSVLALSFQGKIKKGWLEFIVAGDSRQGKSDTAEALAKHYRAGEVISCENVTLAGLVGGIQANGSNHWMVTWGKWPMNDCGLIVLDEMSGMHDEILEKLSGIRSLGVAEVTKILTAKTRARVRTIWTGNVKQKGREISSYSYGVEAIPDLLGNRMEDVARFDYATVVARGEIDKEDMNRSKQTHVKHVYTTELCHDLVTWAWTRKATDIIIDKETEALIIVEANKLSDEYSSRIPLVIDSDERVKLTRVAVAVACRLFSTTTGEDVAVKPGHVMYAAKFLRRLFNKPSMAYDVMSTEDNRCNALSSAMREKLLKEYKTFSGWDQLRDLLLSMKLYKLRDIIENLDWPQEEGRRFAKFCFKNRLITTTAFGYRKQAIFNLFLKSILKEVNLTPEAVSKF